MALAGVYLALALFLNPLLIQHELSFPGDSSHSESDLCAWLDHAAGTLLQSAPPQLTAALLVATVDVPYRAPSRSIVLFVDPSRGPPVLI